VHADDKFLIACGKYGCSSATTPPTLVACELAMKGNENRLAIGQFVYRCSMSAVAPTDTN
jgi:hypothetical protein